MHGCALSCNRGDGRPYSYSFYNKKLQLSDLTTNPVRFAACCSVNRSPGLEWVWSSTKWQREADIAKALLWPAERLAMEDEAGARAEQDCVAKGPI